MLAKGVEDTAFYRWPRLAALNEVGGDPDIFGVSPARVPRRRCAAWRPAGRPRMTTLSTHDTKRQEDVRARLAVLAEWPEEWAHKVAEWHGLAVWLTDGAAAQATERAPEPDLEYLMWQTLVGAWLIGSERCASTSARPCTRPRRGPPGPCPTRATSRRSSAWPTPCWPTRS